MVLALALDPFSQQLIQLEQHLSNSSAVQANIHRAQRYSKGYWSQNALEPGTVRTSVDLSMQAAIVNGLVESYDKVLQTTSMTCTSGNCTWDAFESLAVCSICNNLGDHISTYNQSIDLTIDHSDGLREVFTATGTIYQLPNDIFLSNDNGSYLLSMVTFGTVNASQTMTLQDSDSLIWGMTILKIDSQRDNSTNIKVLALECGLIYCVNLYEPVVRNNAFYENETRASNASRILESYQSSSTVLINDPETRAPNARRNLDSYRGITTTLVNGLETKAHQSTTTILVSVPETRAPNASRSLEPYQSITTTLSQQTITSAEPMLSQWWMSKYDLEYGNGFNISKSAVGSISDYFQMQFASDNNISYRQSDDGGFMSAEITSPANGYYQTTNDNPSDWQYSPSVMQVLYESTNLTDTFRTLARSMSNAIRANADDDGHNIVNGTGAIMVSHCSIQWPWIALHIVLLTCGVVFLAHTIRQTKLLGIPAWKTSSLAPLSRVSDIGDVLDGLQSIPLMQQKASQHFLKFHPDHSNPKANMEPLRPVPTPDPTPVSMLVPTPVSTPVPTHAVPST